ASLLTGLQVDTPLSRLMLSYVLFGLGFGMLNPPLTSTALHGMPASQSGVAGAISSTSRQVGGALGIAVVGAVVGAGSMRSGVFRQGLAVATHPAWWIIAGMGATVLVVALLTTTTWALATARKTAARLS